MKICRSLVGTALLVIFTTASCASAVEPSPCDLLTRDDLSASGFSVHGKPQLQTLTLSKGEQLAPTDIHSEVCFLPVDATGDRYGDYLSIDTFGEVISPAALEAWAKSLDDYVAPGGEIRIGDSTCETGSYDYTEAQEGKRIGTQRYVACDAMRGKRRVSLNLQAPDDRPALPAAEAVHELLEKAWRRL